MKLLISLTAPAACEGQQWRRFRPVVFRSAWPPSLRRLLHTAESIFATLATQ